MESGELERARAVASAALEPPTADARALTRHDGGGRVIGLVSDVGPTRGEGVERVEARADVLRGAATSAASACTGGSRGQARHGSGFDAAADGRRRAKRGARSTSSASGHPTLKATDSWFERGCSGSATSSDPRRLPTPSSAWRPCLRGPASRLAGHGRGGGERRAPTRQCGATSTARASALFGGAPRRTKRSG